MASRREDFSYLRQPSPADPWPGGSTTERWPCWCTKCKGEYIRMRHIRDAHMLKDGVYTRREDFSYLRQPSPADPWPGGSTTERWPCWCTKCKGEHIRMRHIRDAHMLKDGVYTSAGVSNGEDSGHHEPTVGTQQEVGQQNIACPDYIVQPNGDIISPLSIPGGGNSTAGGDSGHHEPTVGTQQDAGQQNIVQPNGDIISPLSIPGGGNSTGEGDLGHHEPTVGTQQDAGQQNIAYPDYIVQPNGDIITPLSIPGGGNSTASLHMRSLLKGYNPRHYGYYEPLPINTKFRCWDRMWEIKQSTLGKEAGLGLFAGEDIVVGKTREGKVTNAILFPYSGPTYRYADWEMIVYEWPQIKAYCLLSNNSTKIHYRRWEYIDGTPSYSWCIASYIKSGINNRSIVNVKREDSFIRSPLLHIDTKLPHVRSVAIRTIRVGEELVTRYP